jgi:halocyanin-like protein
MRTSGGVAGAGAAAGAGLTLGVGTVAAEEEPDWPEEVTDAPNYSETEDLRGEEEVVVEVGAGDGLQFAPPAIWIDEGTTVVWEWTGEGGGHNVVSQDGEEFESDTDDSAGFTFEHTFEEGDQISYYVCTPHEAQNMYGGVAVGDDIETIDADEAAEMEPTDMGVDIREHYVGVGAILAIVVSLIFTFYTLKYGESPNAKGGN